MVLMFFEGTAALLTWRALEIETFSDVEKCQGEVRFHMKR